MRNAKEKKNMKKILKSLQNGLRKLPKKPPNIYFVSCLFAIILCSSVITFADRRDKAIDEINRDAHPVSEGERSPVTGIVLPTELAIKLGFRVEALEHRLKVDIEREKILCQAHLRLKDKEISIYDEALIEQSSLCEEQLKSCQENATRKQPWHKGAFFGFILGMTLTGILTATMIYVGTFLHRD